MRKLLIALLLAGAAATPALADPGDWHSNRENRGGDSRDSRGDRHQSDSNSTSTSNSSQNQSDNGSSPRHFSGGQSGGHDDSNAGSNQGGSQGGRHHDVSSSGGGGDNNGGMNWRGRGSFTGSGQHDNGGQQDSGGNHSGWQHRVVESGGSDAGNNQGNGGARDFWQRRTRVAGGGSGDQVAPGGLVQPEHPVPNVFRSRTPVISDTPREGTQPRMRFGDRRATSHVAWNHNWRHDHRYDWWSWRRTHRSIFHLGFYYDPFGWNYQRYDIGWRLWPSYYSSRYWINDPWELRLPYAPPGYRWIRYYDDAILIDTWDGQVVDVIYNFFW